MTNRAEETNLLSRVKAEPLRRPSGFYKAIVFETLTVLIATFAGYLTYDYLTHGGQPLYFVAAFTLYLVFSSLVTLWTRSLSRRSFVLVCEAIAIVGFFYQLSMVALLGLWFAVFAFGFWGIFSTRRLYENSIDLRFLTVIRPQILKMITGLIIVFVVIYPNYRPDALVPSKDFTEGLLHGSAGFIGAFYPDIHADGTVDDFVRTIVEVELANDTRFLSQSPTQKDATISQSMAATEKRFETTFGFPVLGTMPASNFFASIVDMKLGQYKSSFGSSFVIIWMIVVFFIVRSFAAIYYFVVAAIAYVAYQVLIAFEVVRVASEERAREFVEFTQNY